jgi:DNA-binding GntR family transcriptional regulator
MLGVSATPVREALMHLEEAGLVSFKDGKIIIADATPDALREAFELREALEGMSARLAADRRTASELKLIELHARRSLECANAGDLEGFCIADSQFHRTIATSAHSQQLTRYVMNALDLAFTLRNIRAANQTFNARSAHMHVTIAAAVAEGEPDVAEHTMRDHVRSVLHQL